MPNRTIDSVLRLERDGLVWYRHLEFQAQQRPRHAPPLLRVQLAPDPPLRRGRPHDRPLPASRRGRGRAGRVPPVRRRSAGLRVALRRRAAVGDRRGAAPSRVARQARWRSSRCCGAETSRRGCSRRCEGWTRCPGRRPRTRCRYCWTSPSQRYDRATFLNVLGKDRVMQSWLYQMGRDEGEARGSPGGSPGGSRGGPSPHRPTDLRGPGEGPRTLGLLGACCRRSRQCDQPETLRGLDPRSARSSPTTAFTMLIKGSGDSAPRGRAWAGRRVRPAEPPTRGRSAEKATTADPSPPVTAEGARDDGRWIPRPPSQPKGLGMTDGGSLGARHSSSASG